MKFIKIQYNIGSSVSKQIILNIVFAAFFMLAANTCTAGIKIVVHPDNPVSELSKKELVKIFKQKKKSWKNGDAITVLNLPTSNPTKEEFTEKILGMDGENLEKYYLKRAISGKGQPPKVVANSEEIVKLIKNDPTAIGYIDAAQSSESLKVLKIDGKTQIE